MKRSNRSFIKFALPLVLICTSLFTISCYTTSKTTEHSKTSDLNIDPELNSDFEPKEESIIDISQIRYDYISTKKRRVYYDVEGNRISKRKFAALADYYYVIDRNIEYETYYESRLFCRQKFGQLSSAEFSDFLVDIESSTGLKMDGTKPIMIGFFQELSPSENCTLFYHAAHWAKLKKRRKHNYYSIANNKIQFDEQVLECNYDSLGLLTNLFFNEYVTCSNWLVIKPDGSYRIFYGEGGPEIFDTKELAEWDEDFIKQNTKTSKKG